MTSSTSLRDASVLITGASRGIGRSVALAAAKTGARLILVARDARRLAEVARAAEARGAPSPGSVVADLERAGGLEAVVAAVPKDGLFAIVHAAGICELGQVEETSPDVLDRSWQVNLRAPYLLTARLLPALRARRGHVVLINSGAGRAAKAGWSAYAVAKHGLRALADALREEVAPDGIRVTSVFPGRTATDMQASVRAQEGKPYDPSVLVQPEDVASAVIGALTLPPPAVVEEIVIRPMPA